MDWQFSPLQWHDGYLPLRDLALLGDGATAALVGRDGSVVWLCPRRFDAPPLFCALLDHDRGGAFRIAPEGLQEARQRYDGETAVVVTELRGSEGTIRVTDALTLRSAADLMEHSAAARGELVRCVEALDGPVTVEVDVQPRGRVHLEPRGGGLNLQWSEDPDLPLQLSATAQLDGLSTRHRLGKGDRLDFVLAWHGGQSRHESMPPPERVAKTADAWRRWIGTVEYDGLQSALVRRSAMTLKLLDYFPTGAIVAAPTSSLPEAIGGQRNWDYRYSWIRDAAMSVRALRRVGFPNEAAGFLAWVLDTVEGHDYPGVMFNVDGQEVPPERTDTDLAGYRGSAPVRWGNGARHQRQHDSYGEILDCAYQWSHSVGGDLDPHLWRVLCVLADEAAHRWREPDHGIWEVRTARRAFTYSAGLCHVAVDRAARLSEQLGLPGDVRRWRATADEIERAILDESWNPEIGALTQHVTGGGLDASILALPLRRVVPAKHPRMIATTDAVRRHLGAGRGLLHRYLPEFSPDGVSGGEGAFLLCSFWLVEVLAHQGRQDEAGELFDDLCGRASPLGLLPEQVDPETGLFLGNYPQALSHIGVLSSAITLAST